MALTKNKKVLLKALALLGMNIDDILREAEVLGQLSAVNAKKIDLPHPQVDLQETVALESGGQFGYSVADLIEDVKDIYPDTFSNDVYEHFEMERKKNSFSNHLVYQKKKPSNRTLLANALETVVQNDIERNKLTKYKEKIDLLNKEEEKLRELNEQIYKLSFPQKGGKKDQKKINELRFEANQTVARIHTLDKSLFNLEASEPLKKVLQREKEQIKKRERQKSKENIDEKKSTREKQNVSEDKPLYQSVGHMFYKDPMFFSYDFLVSQKKMSATVLPELSILRNEQQRIDTAKVVKLGLANAKKVGEMRGDKIYVKNAYTGFLYRIDTQSIRHGLNGEQNRLLTNSRLGAVIGDVVKNAIPINELTNTNAKAIGTYALAGYAFDSDGREFVCIVTIEQFTGDVIDVELYDVAHALSGRQKKNRSKRFGTKPQGVNPNTNASAEISISDFLGIVNSTHQSILSDDVLEHLGEERNPGGYYANRVLHQKKRPINTVYERKLLTDTSEIEEEDSSLDLSLYSYESRGTDFYKDKEVYSYDFLVHQEPMIVSRMPELNAIYTDGKIDKVKIISAGKENALAQDESWSDTNGTVYVKNRYTKSVIKINNQSIKHGLGGKKNFVMTNARLGMIIGDIIRNGIPINQLTPSNGATDTYAMVAYAVSPANKEFLVIAHIDVHTNELVDFDSVFAVHSLRGRIKRGSTTAVNSAQGLSDDKMPFGTSTISISDLLGFVNETSQSLLSADVLNHFGEMRTPDGYYTNSVLHQKKRPTNRTLLSNALETVVQNDIERNKLTKYKEKIDLLNKEEEKLRELNEQIYRLSFPQKGGKKDQKKINELRFEANQTVARIHTLDKSLFNLEASEPLKKVLQREKEQIKKRERQKGKEALADLKAKNAAKIEEIVTRHREIKRRGIESRNITALRGKIKKTVKTLNDLLLKGNEDKHVPLKLQKAVAAALDAVNMDTVGAEERVAKYDALIAEATDPDIIASLKETRDRIQGQGDRLGEKLDLLKAAYEEIQNSEDPDMANAYDETIVHIIESVKEEVGDRHQSRNRPLIEPD